MPDISDGAAFDDYAPDEGPEPIGTYRTQHSTRQIILVWSDSAGAEVGRRFYPRTDRGLAAWKRKVARLDEAGYADADTEPQASDDAWDRYWQAGGH